MQSIVWLAEKQYPLHGLALILGLLVHRIKNGSASKAIADTAVIDVLNHVVATSISAGILDSVLGCVTRAMNGITSGSACYIWRWA